MPKLNENTELSMPIRNLIALVAAATLGTWAYFGVIERLNTIENKLILAETDMAMNTGIAQMQEPMSGEAMGMSGGGTPFVMPTMAQLEEMARQQGKTVQQLQAELTQQSLNPVQKRRASRNVPDPAPPPPA